MTRLEKLEAVAAAADAWERKRNAPQIPMAALSGAANRLEAAVLDLRAFAALTAAGYAVVRRWQPIETAPRDRLVEVYAPSPDPARWTPEVHNLPPIVCLARWHPDGGFCVCEIREVTHWREHIPPAGEVK